MFEFIKLWWMQQKASDYQKVYSEGSTDFFWKIAILRARPILLYLGLDTSYLTDEELKELLHKTVQLFSEWHIEAQGLLRQLEDFSTNVDEVEDIKL